jgi:glycosyltransferase involved in cell wall biosynthesis
MARQPALNGHRGATSEWVAARDPAGFMDIQRFADPRHGQDSRANAAPQETVAPSTVAKRPKVSLCIPAYQAEDYLQATIDSVLAQNYADMEIVVVDNNSSDGTRAILESIDDDRVRVVRNPATLSMADNFNLAVQLCQGTFVKLLCADDTLEPGCLAAQAAVLEDNPDVALVASQTDFIDDDGVLLLRARGLRGIVGRQSAQRVVRQVVRSGRNPIGAPVAAMFRRADFDRCGGFDGDLLFVMDMDLWVRLLRNGDFVGVPRALASFRVRTDSSTALTAASSQLAQQLEFVRRMYEDTRWEVSAFDRAIGRVRAFDMQLRRCLLFELSRMRVVTRHRRAFRSIEHNVGRST